jgi:hypothetical protein
MKEENSEEELDTNVDQSDDQSWLSTTKTVNVPFSNFYIRKGNSSNELKLSEQSSKFISLLNMNEMI